MSVLHADARDVPLVRRHQCLESSMWKILSFFFIGLRLSLQLDTRHSLCSRELVLLKLGKQENKLLREKKDSFSCPLGISSFLSKSEGLRRNQEATI